MKEAWDRATLTGDFGTDDEESESFCAAVMNRAFKEVKSQFTGFVLSSGNWINLSHQSAGLTSNAKLSFCISRAASAESLGLEN